MTARYVRSAHVLWRRTLRGIVARVPEGTSVLLDGSGPMIWELLGRPVTLGELSALLADQVDADPTTIAQDVTATLEELERARVVEVVA